MAINLASKFSKYVDDAFARESLLRGAVNNKVEFTGGERGVPSTRWTRWR